MEAETIIENLALSPHPEGGWYRQTWAADGPGRPAGTCIYYLLRAGEESRWHRIDSAEIWHFYAGEPLRLWIAPGLEGPAEAFVLGPDIAAGQRPQIIVPPRHWQAAAPTGAFTLAGCTVSPGFSFDHFEMAPAGTGIPQR